MGRKEEIIHVLENADYLTEAEIESAVFLDAPAKSLYIQIKALFDDGKINRSKDRPYKYSLKAIPPLSPNKEVNVALIEASEKEVSEDPAYGREDNLITECLNRFPYNTDPVIVIMKIGLIDITNSTNLSRYKSRINMAELADIICKIPDIDERIEKGDPTVVEEIAKSNGNINLFSFASKYCCYHNKNYYKKDDYSIFDTILSEHLSDYFTDITKTQIDEWRTTFNYKDYNDYITRKLDELAIHIEYRKRKFDHFVWFSNR